eukprot:CAMPEP_0117447462 /NCGR_PEP_ID=MMETSP0759-20121206/6888_1 /TAXON_ID=63605 /ORGANISM="Percolomonas cosmopolitus, Strain WS" /LENGTH=616 /DNA_ID=CAMNT_0005239799 /DNA_START=190 /DNA_END=2040 /DNA_ORIENTATION=+
MYNSWIKGSLSWIVVPLILCCLLLPAFISSSLLLASTPSTQNPDSIPTHSLYFTFSYTESGSGVVHQDALSWYEFGTPCSFYLERENTTDLTVANLPLRIEYMQQFHFLVSEQDITDIFRVVVVCNGQTSVLAELANQAVFWEAGNHMPLDLAFDAFRVEVHSNDSTLNQLDYRLFVDYGDLSMYLGLSKNGVFNTKLYPKALGGVVTVRVGQTFVVPVEVSQTLTTNETVVPVTIEATPVSIHFKSDDKRRHIFNHYTTGPMNDDHVLIRVTDPANKKYFFYTQIQSETVSLWMPPDVSYTIDFGLQGYDGTAHFFDAAQKTFTNTNPREIVFPVYKYFGRVAVKIDKDSTFNGAQMILNAEVKTASNQIISVRTHNFVYGYMIEEYGMLVPYGDAVIKSSYSMNQVMGSAELNVEHRHQDVSMALTRTKLAVFAPRFGEMTFQRDSNPLTLLNIFYYDANNATIHSHTFYPREKGDPVKVTLPLGVHYYRYWPSGPLHTLNITEGYHNEFLIDEDISSEVALVSGNFHFDQHGSESVFMSCVNMDPQTAQWGTNLIPISPLHPHDETPNVNFQIMLPKGIAECSLMEIYRTDPLEFDAGEIVVLEADDFEQAKI